MRTVLQADSGWADAFDLPAGAYLIVLSNKAHTGIEGRKAGLYLRDTICVMLPKRIAFAFLFRTPLAYDSVIENVYRKGVGALNIQACRVGVTGGGTHCTNRDKNGKCRGHKNAGRSTSGETFHGPDTSGGRWPTNIVFSDERWAKLLDEQSGVSKSCGGSGEASKSWRGDDSQVGAR
jgi:hypothetical protein